MTTPAEYPAEKFRKGLAIASLMPGIINIFTVSGRVVGTIAGIG